MSEERSEINPKIPYHIWGDGFDFDELYDAQEYICKMYKRICGKHPITKEKYGTIRYEFKEMWLTSPAEAAMFLRIVKKATHKFPNVKGEIVDDLVAFAPTVAETSTQEQIMYLKGYLTGLLFGVSGSEWESYNRTTL